MKGHGRIWGLSDRCKARRHDASRLCGNEQWYERLRLQCQHQLEQLSLLSDDWDGEGAPAPYPATIARASRILDQALAARLFAPEIDPDVIGGVSLLFSTSSSRGFGVAVIVRLHGGSLTISCSASAMNQRTPGLRRSRL